MILRFLVALTLALLVIVIAVILGDYGPWYLSWLLGTGFMILAAVSGAILLDAQEEAARSAAAARTAGTPRG